MFSRTPGDLAEVPCEAPVKEGVPAQLSLEIVLCVAVTIIVVAMGLLFIGSKDLEEFFKTASREILRQVLTPHF